MSTKSKASSKNKKAPAKKTVKKAVAKKASRPVATKKTAKPVAKAKPAKKATAKAKIAKKAARPVATKKVAPKKTAAKKPVKKASPKKAVKKVTSRASVTKKVAPKKAVAKKAVKKVASKASATAKKVAVKKIVKKATPKKASNIKKAIAKKVAPKKVAKTVTLPVGKAGKNPVKKAAVKAKPVAKKALAPLPVGNKKEVKPLHSKTSTVKEIKHIIEEVEHKAEKTVTNTKAKKEKASAPVIKKSIVAPTTFRQEDPTPAKFIKEPAGKFEMEFVIRASEDMVYEFVSTESGLSEWFCDDVNIRNGIFTFNWEGQEQQAKLVKEIPPVFIRYQWLDKNDGSYFEFRTQKDELTNDISLIITDFASDKLEEESSRLLWHSQVDKLLHVLGSFF